MFTQHTVRIGATFQTGQVCTESGVYRFTRHVDGTYCSPSPAEARIPLAKGNTFPPHRHANGGKGVVWMLESYA